MNLRIFLSIALFCLFFACKKAGEACEIVPNTRFYTQMEMNDAFRDDVIERLAGANQADANGALGRNQEAYFHVRFQMGLSYLADYAVATQDLNALDMFVKSVEYSFQHQLANGNFELIIPSDLQGTGTLKASDSASANAFFLSSLASSLLLLKESTWAQSQSAYWNRLQQLNSNYQLALDWLTNNSTLLEEADAQAPNRLFFDALAFYGLGRYLNDNNAMTLGKSFANKAIALQAPQGYFKEGDGWDSSYQGVGLSVGFRLLNAMDASEPMRQQLYDVLACGTHWESSKIKKNGKICTVGNSRVHAGGETFLGEEKEVAYSSVVIAFWNMYYYSNASTYNDLAESVLDFYQ